MIALRRAWPAIVVLAGPLWPAWAQTPPAAQQGSELREARERWRQANERVGEFPRGHIDLLRWERANLPPTASAPAGAAPLGMDEAVRRSLVLRPELFGAAPPNEVVARERHLALLQHVVQVRQSWLDAVLAGAALRFQLTRSEVADSGAELGQRMVQAGNWSQARLLREQITQAQEAVALLQARQTERRARERLAQALGLTRADDLAALSQRLPTDLPDLPEPVPTALSEALENQVLAADSALARQRLLVGRQLGALPDGGLAPYTQALERSLPTWSAEQLPKAALVIDDPRLARNHTLAEAAEAQAAVARAEAERRSQARQAWGRLQDQQALAQRTQTVLKLVTAQEQETLLRYNGMLQSTWELLGATRERLGASAATAQARHAAWTAWLDWQLLAAGGPYRATESATPTAEAAAAEKDH
jgi:hypothetical protein